MALQDRCPIVGDDTPSSSPKTRLKFLCSHGGKILHRPFDGLLEYVGGETRIVAVPRDINFSDLIKKINALFDGDMVLKYQLLPEDLVILMSVKSDEDLKHMLDEYDRRQTEGSPKFRAFLFNSYPSISDNQTESSGLGKLTLTPSTAWWVIHRATQSSHTLTPILPPSSFHQHVHPPNHLPLNSIPMVSPAITSSISLQSQATSAVTTGFRSRVSAVTVARPGIEDRQTRRKTPICSVT